MTRLNISILPPHPPSAGYDRNHARGSIADDFQRRLEPANFNPLFFTALTGRIEQALAAAPQDPELRYQLAFLLLQNNTTPALVDRAAELLAGTPYPGGERLLTLIDGIRQRAAAVAGPGQVRRVNWSINNRCPMACRGCYNAFVDGQITYRQATTIVDKLADHGVTDVVLAGGDPLLWKHIFDVVAYAVDAGLKVALDTTGYTLTADRLARLSQLASLRLPLDGTTPAIQRAFRRSKDPNLTRALNESLDLCDRTGFHKVRVHTVASKANLHDLASIADNVLPRPSVRQWVIFQWWDRRATDALREELHIDAEPIRAEIAKIKEKYPDADVILADTAIREFLNWMVLSNGQVVTFGTGPEEEFIIGDLLLDDVETIASHPILDHQAMDRGVPVTPRR
ncbi:radical SAM protein [Streptomyces sp. NPDC058548]|uniref:radical SAM protein n=1 Tax=Streptomyces sp. NPDC058548 TaxID=3346545 RepID=UPI003656EA9B